MNAEQLEKFRLYCKLLNIKTLRELDFYIRSREYQNANEMLKEMSK